MYNYMYKMRPSITKKDHLCTQQRLQSAWVFDQSYQSLRCLAEESFGPEQPINRIAKTDQIVWMHR